MFIDTILIIFISLVLTIILELGVWKSINYLFKQYNLKFIWLAIIAANMATNPVFNVISSLLDPARIYMYLEFGFELLIIVIEAMIFFLIYKKDFKKFIILSTVINVLSYGVGLLLFRPIWF